MAGANPNICVISVTEARVIRLLQGAAAVLGHVLQAYKTCQPHETATPQAIQGQQMAHCLAGTASAARLLVRFPVYRTVGPSCCAGHGQQVVQLASAAGAPALLASLARDGELRTWDAAAGACTSASASQAVSLVRDRPGADGA